MCWWLETKWPDGVQGVAAISKLTEIKGKNECPKDQKGKTQLCHDRVMRHLSVTCAPVSPLFNTRPTYHGALVNWNTAIDNSRGAFHAILAALYY